MFYNIVRNSFQFLGLSEGLIIGAMASTMEAVVTITARVGDSSARTK